MNLVRGSDATRPRCARPDVEIRDLLVHATSAGVREHAGMRRHVPDDLVGEVAAAAARQRVTGFVLDAVSRDALGASSPSLARLEIAHRHATMRVLMLERVLLSVVDILGAGGIASRILKGPAVARTLYADPAVRTFLDIDLLVPARDLDAAVAVLTAAGLRRMLPELRPGFDRRFAKTVTFLHPSGCQVDLHRTLVVGPFGLLVDRRDLFADRRSLEVAGRQMHTLGRTAQFLNLCYHAALGDFPARLTPLRDVAEALRDPALDLDSALAIAEGWHGSAVVARAVGLAASLLDLPACSAVRWARSYQPGGRERRLLACYTSPYRSNSRKYLATAATIPGLADKAAFLRALLLPSSDFVADRARDPARWWMHGLASLITRSRRRETEAMSR